MTGDPFVGRGAQLAQLRAWADGVVESGVGRFVMVVGEAGVGKTRLCSEFARLPPPGAGTVAWSRSWVGGGSPPLWPWPDLVAELGSRQGGAPEVVPTSDSLDRFGLFRTVEEQLRTLCSTGPGVAIIDDLHAASQDALLLTRFVARSLHRIGLLLVVTWRTGGRGELPEEALVLGREGHVMELPPLGADDVAAYVELSDQPRPTPDEIAQLVDCTGGNPMYVAEVLRQGWRDPTARVGGLALVLARRVAEVDGSRRHVLGAAALLGSGATVAETAQVLGCRPADVLEVVSDDSLGATRVGNEIHFSHELLRAAYVAALPLAERQRLHDAARDALQGYEADRVVRRAYHAVEAAPLSADHAREAIAACLEAVGTLQSALAFEQAVEWAGRACALASEASDPTLKASALVAHATAVLGCGRLATARDLFGQAVQAAEAASDPRLLAEAALGYGGVWVEEQRDELSRRRLAVLCRRALDGLPSDEAVLAARLSVRLAAERAYDGEGRVEEVVEAVERARRLGDPAATAEALSLYHHTLLLPDTAAVRLQVADELLDVATHAEAAVYSLFGLCWRTVDLYHLAHPEAEAAFVSLREQVTALGNQSIGYIVAVLETMRTFRRGDLRRAEALAEEALTLGTAAGDADAASYYGGHVLAIRWAQGRLGELLETIGAVLESSTLRRRDQIYRALLAYAHAVRGDHAAARTVLDGLLADGVDAIPTFSTWSGTMAVLVETAAELDDGELALDLAARFVPVAHRPVMPSLAVTCLGPGERIMGVALRTGRRWDEAIAWLRRALDANQRLGNRPFDAVIRADLAAALRRRGGPGDGDQAAGLLAEAISTARQLGMTGRAERWERLSAGLAHGPEATPRRASLERQEGTWRVSIDDRATTVDHVVGMRYLAELVARPDTDIAAIDLSAVITGGEIAAPVGSRQPVLDARARSEYRDRLVQLDRELEAADRTGDVERGRRAARERESLLDALRRDTGLGGRSRPMTDESERCRMRVSKAIHRALERVRRADPVLGRALASRIRTGHVCRYTSDPERPITWTVRTKPTKQPPPSPSSSSSPS